MKSRSRIELDGKWFFFTEKNGEINDPQKLTGLEKDLITVPSPWQADARYRDFSGTAWYQRSFDCPPDWVSDEQVILLCFGAVDYLAEVWINDTKVGCHEGGYLPFELDISSAVQEGSNSIFVKVQDPPELFAEVPHGKQSWYGLLSGIWQSVHIEVRPAMHIKRLKITPVEEEVEVEVTLANTNGEKVQIAAEVYSPDGILVKRVESFEVHFSISIPQPQRWSPEEPNLYVLKVCTPQDEISQSFGFRTIEIKLGQILLNGVPFYMRSVLDQDYYPELICTPPSQEYIEDEFRKAKAMGLNCIRVHIKVADPRYYAAADKIGLLIWTELPNQIILTEDAKTRIRETLAGMIERDWNHPCIGIWTIFNESWGIDLTDPEQRAWLAETYHWMKKLDPTRLVVDNSACWGNFHVETDIADFHNYYAMPDHHERWRDWVANYADHPGWIFTHPYSSIQDWRDFSRDPWQIRSVKTPGEGYRSGEEVLLVSEFGNWGLPDVIQLKSANHGETPWWFETGLEWGDGVVYPHGVEKRFKEYHLDKIFGTFPLLALRSQRLQFEALRYEIEEIRRHDRIKGYVITEFTDVHWESNGLLDMYRNPKAHFQDLSWLNADDVLIPIWPKQAYTAGENFELLLLCSHYSTRKISGAILKWTLLDQGTDVLNGELTGINCADHDVSKAGSVRFVVPTVKKPGKYQLALVLIVDGQIIARTRQEIYVFPAPKSTSMDRSLKVYAPDFEQVLSQLGYRLVSKLDQADVAVVSRLDDATRDFIAAGKNVFFLAEKEDALQTHLPGVQLKNRENTPWAGDWASTLGWHRFSEIPTDGVVNFAFREITPDVVLQGFAPRDFNEHVLAGLFVGWLHKPVATIVRKKFAKSEILISTFRLSKNLESNALALYLFDHLLTELLEKPN